MEKKKTKLKMIFGWGTAPGEKEPHLVSHILWPVAIVAPYQEKLKYGGTDSKYKVPKY